MKPTIDPISGMPYLSHVNDIETIAALRAENERLTDILISCCNAAGGQAVRGVSVDFLVHVPVEIAGRIERLTRERDGYRDAAASNWASYLDLEEKSTIARTKLLKELGLTEQAQRIAEAERDQLREQLAAANTRIEELRNVAQVAAFALAETRTK